MSAPSLIWFQIVDAATGKSYKGTSADYVSPPPGSVIAQFRDAVKTKYDQPGYLKDIPAGALHVYKNKAAFVDGKEEPLKSSCPLGGLGETEEESFRRFQ